MARVSLAHEDFVVFVTASDGLQPTGWVGCSLPARRATADGLPAGWRKATEGVHEKTAAAGTFHSGSTVERIGV
jgi:hypothetical protein